MCASLRTKQKERGEQKGLREDFLHGCLKNKGDCNVCPLYVH